MKKFIVLLFLLAFVSTAFGATTYRKNLTDEAGEVTQVFTPDPYKAYAHDAASAKATYCFSTLNVLKVLAQTTRASSFYLNTDTTKTFPMVVNTPMTLGISRYGTGNAHTVTQVCFTNQSGASISIQAQ